jgi:stearoyl-CoA desaturase (delta-9 desaturase)
VSFLGVFVIHLFTAYAFWRGVTWRLALLAFAMYWLRMFGITAGYHRYFSHRAFKTSRAFQFLLALLGVTATQKGPIWWSATHRHHHKHSDQEDDVHSPERRGFWYSHVFWWLNRDHENANTSLVPDLTRYPELRWLDKYHLVGPAILLAATWAIGGLDGALWGYVVSTCVLIHATFTINSLAHVFGSRRYATTDTSRNNVFLALLTMGEGWHNNHHHYMSSARQGFFWWEVDVSYYIIRVLEKIGLVWDVRGVPEHALTRNLLADVGERCELLQVRKRSEPVEAPIDASLADAE